MPVSLLVGRSAAAATHGRDPDLGELLERLEQLRDVVALEADEQLDGWRPRIERRSFGLSARNLAAYLALRRRDLRALQLEMMRAGLS